MFKYRCSASALVCGAMLVSTSIVGLSSPAQAATGAEILVPFRFTVSEAHVLPETFTAGDCRQVGQNQAASLVPSYLTIRKWPGHTDFYEVTWHPTLYTVSTWQQDIWRAKFVFRSAAGPVATMNFDGPWMNEDTIYYPHVSQNITLSQDQVNSITFVDWIGDC